MTATKNTVEHKHHVSSSARGCTDMTLSKTEYTTDLQFATQSGQFSQSKHSSPEVLDQQFAFVVFF